MSDLGASHLVTDALRLTIVSEHTGTFAETLTLGQIIKGRVLRNISDGQYKVSFFGHERIVDSAIPLRANDILFGKVIGLDGQVTLKPVHLIHGDAGDSSKVLTAQKMEDVFVSPEGSLMPALGNATLHGRVQLGTEDQRLLSSLSHDPNSRTAVLHAALILQRFALTPLDGQLLTLLCLAIGQEKKRFNLASHAIIVDTELESENHRKPTDQRNPMFVNALAESLQQLIAASVNDSRDRLSRSSDASKAPRDSALANSDDGINAAETLNAEIASPGNGLGTGAAAVSHLLNAQTDGALKHRVCTIPFVVDGELVEVDIAFFDHEYPDNAPSTGPQARRIVFDLDLPRLGALKIDINLVADRIKAEITTENDEICERVALHAAALRRALVAFGWQVDELTYRIGNSESPSGVMSSVVEHLLAGNSVNRLM